MKRDRADMFGFSRELFQKQKRSVREAEAALSIEQHREKFIERKGFIHVLFHKFAEWFRGIFSFGGFLRPTRKVPIVFQPDTVPVGFESVYDCCGRKLTPKWRKRGNHYRIHHFECYVCRSTTVSRFS